MTEENKKTEEKQEAAVPQGVAPAQPAVPEKPKEAPKTRPTNCAQCNKAFQQRRWYYRNGRFFCNKRCWQSAQKKAEQPAQAA